MKRMDGSLLGMLIGWLVRKWKSHSGAGGSSLRNSESVLWKKVWGACVPGKVNFFFDGGVVLFPYRLVQS